MGRGPVAIVGAGVTGLSVALALRDVGRPAALFDKGRGPGGRTSTRRAGDEAGRGWDHGTPAFTAESTDFAAAVGRWQSGGLVEPWLERDGKTLWTGVPGMSGLCRGLAQGLPLLQGMRVLGLDREQDGWTVRASDRHAGPFPFVVITAPAPQALELLDGASEVLAKPLARVRYEPCWTLLAETGETEAVPLRLAGDEGVPEGIAKIVCEDTKPHRLSPARGMRWTVHADAQWSAARLEEDPAGPGRELTAALEQVLGVPVRRGYAHRWRMARVAKGFRKRFLLDAEAGLAWAGDACLPTGVAPGVEAAWRSGTALGAALA